MDGAMRNSSLMLLTVAALCGCTSSAKRDAMTLTGGDPDRGAHNISYYGCGSCHAIPGVTGAHGQVGPSLQGIGNRLFVAGSLQNNPDQLEHWVRDPHSINSKTVMPNLGVTAQDATDMAA